MRWIVATVACGLWALAPHGAAAQATAPAGGPVPPPVAQAGAGGQDARGAVPAEQAAGTTTPAGTVQETGGASPAGTAAPIKQQQAPVQTPAPTMSQGGGTQTAPAGAAPAGTAPGVAGTPPALAEMMQGPLLPGSAGEPNDDPAASADADPGVPEETLGGLAPPAGTPADAPAAPPVTPPPGTSADTPAAAPLQPADAPAAPPAPPVPPPAKAPVPAPARTAIGPQLPAPEDGTRRCTVDRRSCISVKTYVADVCKVIETAASENRLDPNFLARLLWKESMFEPEAVSPVGALGIAQFMPETARLRKLDDPFNPAKAIHASAAYLRYLIDGFGNVGLAAVAYNGGEARALRFYNGGQVLPFETQDYVEAITGLNAWKWRDEPPQSLDIRLDRERPFHEACVRLAHNRTLKEFATKARAWPWGVILAAHPQQSGAQQQVNRLNRQLRPILGGKRVSYVRKTLRGTSKRMFTAQIGYSSRGEADAFCGQLRALGGRCIVLKN